MKKISVVLLTICICVANILSVSAAAHSVLYDDPEDLNVLYVGKNDAIAEDYYQEGVVNLRCGYSAWDKEKAYKWLISNWEKSAKKPASVYLGDDEVFDMSKITSITFDYVSDTAAEGTTGTRVSLCADPDRTQVVASVDITKFTGGLKNPENIEMTIIDATYSGPLYLCMEYSVRLFVGNLEITTEVDDPTPGATEEVTVTPDVTATAEITATPGTTEENNATPDTGSVATAETGTVTEAPTTENAGTATAKPTTKPNTSAEPAEDNNSSMTWIIVGIAAVVLVAAVALVFVWKKKK